MGFTKTPENLKLKRQINCSISTHDWERWHLICQRNQKTSHEMLRTIVQEYIESHQAGFYSVTETLKNLR